MGKPLPPILKAQWNLPRKKTYWMESCNNTELCWMGTSLYWKRSLFFKIKEWVLTNKRGLVLKRRVKNENLEKKNWLCYLFHVPTFFLLKIFLSLVSFGTFRTQIERRHPYMYIIGLSSLLLDKARIKESEKTEKERVFPAHHCSLHIRTQCGIFILLKRFSIYSVNVSLLSGTTLPIPKQCS